VYNLAAFSQTEPTFPSPTASPSSRVTGAIPFDELVI